MDVYSVLRRVHCNKNANSFFCRVRSQSSCGNYWSLLWNWISVAQQLPAQWVICTTAAWEVLGRVVVRSQKHRLSHMQFSVLGNVGKGSKHNQVSQNPNPSPFLGGSLTTWDAVCVDYRFVANRWALKNQGYIFQMFRANMFCWKLLGVNIHFLKQLVTFLWKT